MKAIVCTERRSLDVLSLREITRPMPRGSVVMTGEQHDGKN